MTTRLDLAGRRRVATVLQAEATECGLACLAMISSYHGRHEDLTSLRHRFGSASRGMNLNRLIDCGTEVGLTPRALRCEVDELNNLNLPAIIHWEYNHFVVLESVTRKVIRVHDPAFGERKVSLKKVGNHFTGIALELWPAECFQRTAPVKRPGLATWFAGLGSLLPALGQILILSAMLQVIALATPFYMQTVVDEVLVKNDVDLLSLLGLGFLGLTVFSLLAQALRGWAGIYLTNQLSYHMGVRLFRHLLRLPIDYFQSRQMGDLVSRFSSLRPIQDFLTSGTATPNF